MADSPQKGHPKFRTFAQDFSAQQEKRGTPKETPSKEEPHQKPEVVPMAKAPGATTEQKPSAKKPVEKPVEPEKVSPVEPKIEKPIELQTEKPKATIPSFHDLQEEVSAIHLNGQAKPVPKPAVTEFTGKKPVPSSTPRVNIGYDSKVITDTKRKRFKLFPAIGASLSNWFKSLTKPKKKKTPSYSVPKADRRKGVIQKATSKSGSVFSADGTDLKEKIRQRQLRQEDERKAEAEAKHEPETSWSPYTDTGYNLVEEGEEVPIVEAPKNVTIEYKKLETVEDNRWQTEPVVEPEPTPVVENESVPQIIVPEEIESPEPVVTSEDTLPEPEPIPEPEFIDYEEPARELEPAVTTIEPTSTDLAENEVIIHNGRKFGINRYNTNTLALASLTLVVTIILIVLVGRLILSTYQTAAPLVFTDTTEPIAGAQLTRLTVTDTQSLLRQLNDDSAASEFGFVDVQVYTPAGEIIPPGRVLELLQFDVLPSFSQSLTDVRFVYLNQSKPIMVFSFDDQATIRGGFLTWEKNLFTDWRLIYDLPLNQTTAFTDQTIGGIDVRVLLSETGQTLIVYGMVDENTALISNSLADFTRVVETSF